jgi:hypothetical protein
MYYLLELVVVVGSVEFVGAILFAVCAAVVLTIAGIRNMIELSAGGVRQVAAFLSAGRTGWKLAAPSHLGSLISKQGKF